MHDLCFVAGCARYFWPLIVIQISKKYKPAIPDFDSAPQSIWLVGVSLSVWCIVHHYFFPWSLTWCRRTGNCWNVDSSENITFPHCFSVQCSYLKTNSNGFFFIFCVKLLFEAGLCYFSPNSSTNLRDTVLWLTSAHLESKTDCLKSVKRFI